MFFFDLKQQYQNLKAEIDAAVLGVLEKGVFIGGEEVENFERSMAEYLGVKHAVSLNSGTDALFLSLKALGIKEGDEVITTPFTFIATADAIAACGAKPIFVDIDPKTFNLDPAALFIKLNELKKLNQLNKLKAVIPVHLFGQMADMAAIMEVANKFGLKVVEDCAQSLGAEQSVSGEQQEGEKSNKKKGYLDACAEAEISVKSGTVGDFGCFSFFPTKNLGACGDGGMIATNDNAIYEKIKLLKAHGSSPQDKYRHLSLGVNSRLDAIQAAILNVKIKHLDEWNKKRAEIAGCYNEALKDIDGLITPAVNFGNTHVYHQYTIRVAKREQLQKFLKEKGIPIMVYYSIPLHLQSAFGYLGEKAGDFPEAECAAKEVMSLPIYPEMNKKDQDSVIKAIKEFYGTKA
ncbi:MAG TPA: DegT/DnrJ/EryC1/StrS family aminotransferase [Candidatus Paceibacterota bacterium]|nr:DegT/DnrJ/EryC1/StrS family aminotransferase [Candidatus Pacearchaeota archaeon]HRZ50678.1 DegT/DnrJ/EryC1/StrS family aminotransferase [Candidatus Paceibacterota bacterium]HSA36425.1 DegT/DnrJ/EryC1/StrS family aminotransferase [Candidatus Paceibacterota bacterium]